MKILAKLNVYNFALLEARKEKGFTQVELAEMANVSLELIGCLERLRQPRMTSRAKFLEDLRRISVEVDREFDELFPLEYLKSVWEKRLLQRGASPKFITDIRLERLATPGAFQLPETLEDVVEAEVLENLDRETIKGMLDDLPPKERMIVELRNGFGCDPHTLEECAKKVGKTRERIRQLEAQAMRRLRHPRILKQLNTR